LISNAASDQAVQRAKKTGLAKAAACFAALLLISLGLCGMNFFALIKFGNPTQSTSLLMVTAWTELVGIIVGLLGLVVIAVVGIAKALVGRLRDSEQQK
jgi:hypothetical protein